MDRPIIVDSNVLIDFLRGDVLAVEYVRQRYKQLVVPAVVLAELQAGVKGPDEQARLDLMVDEFPVQPIDRAIALKAGLIKRQYHPSHGVSLADAIIAASAHETQSELATLNVKHFPSFADLQPAYRKPPA